MVQAHRIHPSLIRPVLIAGAEPAAAALEGLTAGALLIGAGFHIATILLAMFYLTGVHTLMVWVASQDPQMTQLYLRSLRAKDYYEPLPRLCAAMPPVCPAVPKAAQ